MPKQDTHESGQSSSDPASRFTAVYEAGLHAAPYGQVLESELLKTGWIVNLPQMQLTDDLPEKIKDLSALTLYRSLMHYGPQDCLDALEVMTPEQFTGLLDFSAWTEGDRLSLVKAAKWLDLLNNISSEVLFQHFSSPA